MKIRHIHDPYDSKGPAITIVSNLFYKPAEKYPSSLEFALAICNPGDNFSKKVGVALATQRITEGDSKYYRYIKIDCQRKLTASDCEDLIDATIAVMDIPEFAYKLMYSYCSCYR